VLRRQVLRPTGVVRVLCNAAHLLTPLAKLHASAPYGVCVCVCVWKKSVYMEAKFNKNLNASALAPNPGTNGTHTKSLTLIRWERNSQNSAFSRKDYRIYLYHKFDLIFNLSQLLLVGFVSQ